MRTSDGVRRSARTLVTRYFGRGFDHKRYIIERYQSDCQRQFRPRRSGKSTKDGSGEARKATDLRTVRRFQ